MGYIVDSTKSAKFAFMIICFAFISLIFVYLIFNNSDVPAELIPSTQLQSQPVSRMDEPLSPRQPVSVPHATDGLPEEQQPLSTPSLRVETRDQAAARQPDLISSRRSRLDQDAELMGAAEQVSAPLMEMLDFQEEPTLIIEEARRLMHHPNRYVREDVLEALWWVGPTALAAIAPMMDDPDLEIRIWARESFFADISSLGDPVAIAQVLQIAAQSSEPSVRDRAVDALIDLPVQLAFPVLATMLEDLDEDVRVNVQNEIFGYSGLDFHSEREAMIWFEQNRATLMD